MRACYGYACGCPRGFMGRVSHLLQLQTPPSPVSDSNCRDLLDLEPEWPRLKFGVEIAPILKFAVRKLDHGQRRCIQRLHTLDDLGKLGGLKALEWNCYLKRRGSASQLPRLPGSSKLEPKRTTVSVPPAFVSKE